MRHVFAAIVVGLLLAPASAQAAAWDWIKELSGPGPSKGHGSVIGTLCVIEPEGGVRSVVNTTPGWSPVPCFFIDRRAFENKDDDNFPNRVRIEAWDFGVSWKRQRGGLELGVGLGFMRFKSEDLITNSGEMTRTKFTLTVGRGIIAPIRLLRPGDTGAKGAWARVLKVYGRVNMITGKIDSTDFGVRAGSGAGESSWDGATNELVPSGGILIDLGELIFRFR